MLSVTWTGFLTSASPVLASKLPARESYRGSSSSRCKLCSYQTQRRLQELQHLLQDRTLQLIADVIGTAHGQRISLDEARQWTVGDYMSIHYQVEHHESVYHLATNYLPSTT